MRWSAVPCLFYGNHSECYAVELFCLGSLHVPVLQACAHDNDDPSFARYVLWCLCVLVLLLFASYSKEEKAPAACMNAAKKAVRLVAAMALKDVSDGHHLGQVKYVALFPPIVKHLV